MPRLYVLTNGKIRRRDLNGNHVIVKTGEPFVPTPSEYAAERFRLVDTGKVVDWTSVEAKIALENTNKLDFPTFGQQDTKPATVKTKDVPSPVGPPFEDIRKVNANIGIAAIRVCNDIVLLGNWREQEEHNDLYTRNSVIKSIDVRIAELSPKPVDAVSAE